MRSYAADALANAIFVPLNMFLGAALYVWDGWLNVAAGAGGALAYWIAKFAIEARKEGHLR